jgi:flagellar biosynthesis protein FlhG
MNGILSEWLVTALISLQIHPDRNMMISFKAATSEQNVEFLTHQHPTRHSMGEILAIGGGKGGAGKSFITANLGALIARRGHRVIMLDLDLGASNLHTFLGIRNPNGGIADFLNKSVTGLEQVTAPTPIANLSFISSVHCTSDIANLLHAQKVKLINALKKLPFDFILLDIGAGTHFNTLDFFLTSETGILVCTPEPTSIENVFRFIKSAYIRKLKQIIRQYDFHPIVKKIVIETVPQAATDIFEAVARHDPGREVLLRESIGRCRFYFILNQFRKHIDPMMGEKITTVCNRHFDSQFRFLGNVSYDERVPDTVIGRVLFTLKHADSETSADLASITDRLTRKKTVFERLSEAP